MSRTHNIILVLSFAILVCNYVTAQSNSTNTTSESRKPTFFAAECRPEHGIYLLNSTYRKNLDYILSNLTDQSKLDTYGESGASLNTPDAVYGQYYCRGDILLNSTLCSACVEAAAQRVGGTCSGYKNGVVWFQECTLRISNATIVGVERAYPRAWWVSASSVSDRVSAAGLNDTLAKLVHVAAFDSNETGYATGEGKVYSLVQCSRDLVGPACDTCLREAVSCGYNLTAGYSLRWAFVYLASCQVSYSTVRRFYALPGNPPEVAFAPDRTEPPPGPVQSAASAAVVVSSAPPSSSPTEKKTGRLVAILVVAVCLGFTMLCCLSCIWFCVLRKEVKHMNSTRHKRLQKDESDAESDIGRRNRS